MGIVRRQRVLKPTKLISIHVLEQLPFSVKVHSLPQAVPTHFWKSKPEKRTNSTTDAQPFISNRTKNKNRWHSTHLHPLGLAALSFSGRSHWFWGNPQNASSEPTPWQSPSCATNSRVKECPSEMSNIAGLLMGAGLDFMKQNSIFITCHYTRQPLLASWGIIAVSRKYLKSPLTAQATQNFLWPARLACLLAARPGVGSQPQQDVRLPL